MLRKCNKKLKKVFRSMIAVMLIIFNICIIGIDSIEGFYSSGIEVGNIENQTIDTQNANVTFDSFFGDSSTNWATTTSTLHSKTASITANPPAMLGVRVKVLNGTLTQGSIVFKDLNDGTVLNYQITSNVAAQTTVSSFDKANKTITLNAITNSTVAFPVSLAPLQDTTMLLIDISQTSKVVFTGTYTDNLGNITQISKEIYVNVAWTHESLGMKLETKINKYVPKEILKTVTLEVAVKVSYNVSSADYVLPIKNTTLAMTSPKFNSIAPNQITVRANSTQATNGKMGPDVIFDSTNWTYNSTTGIITVTMDNDLGSGYSYIGHGIDEYVIECIFPIEAYVTVGTSNNVTCDVTGTIEYYNTKSTTKTITGTYNTPLVASEIIGKEQNTLITKGLLYSNGIAQLYTTGSIGLTDITDIDSLGMKFATFKFLDNTGNKVETYINDKYYIHTTSTRIEKTEFDTVLGPTGYVKIYDKNGTLVGTIDSSSNISPELQYYTEYTDNVGDLSIETSKPLIGNTILNITQVDELGSNLPFTKTEIKSFNSLVGTIYYSNRKTGSTTFDYHSEITPEYLLKSVKSNASILIENGTLKSTEVNKNVIFKISLNNTDRELHDLYTDPIFQIELPEYITKVDINSYRININTGIAVTDCKIVTGKNGNLAIQVTTTGAQQYYYSTPAIIEVNTDITTTRLMPNADSKVQLYFYNKYVDTYGTPVEWSITGVTADGQNGYAETPIRLTTTNEMLCVSEITDYEQTGKIISSVDQIPSDVIAPKGTAITAKMNLKVMNNNTTPATNTIILGRIPFANNKKIISEGDLGSTFNTVLKSQITSVENAEMTVYYSDKGDATRDLSDTTNNWTTTPADLSTIKSYLIVLGEEYAMTPGILLTFNYDFEIPADVEYEDAIFANFGVYYSLGTEIKTAESGPVGILTREEPKLEVTKTVSVGDGTPVTGEQIIEYVITVKNTNEFELDGVVIHDTVPEGTVYVTEDNGTYIPDATKTTIESIVGTLQPGGQGSYSFKVKVNPVAEGENVILRNVAYSTSTEIVNPVYSEEVENEVLKDSFTLEKTVSVASNSCILENGEMEYTINATNITAGTIQDVVITDVIPAGVTYKEAYILKYNTLTNSYDKDTTNVLYNAATRTVTWTIGEMQTQEQKIVKLVVTTDKITDQIDIKQVVNNAKISGVGTKETISGDVKTDILKDRIKVDKTSNVSGNSIKEGESIKYTIKVTNNYDDVDLENVKIVDILPAGLEYVTSQCTDEITVEYDAETRTVSVTTNIKAKKEITLEIMTKVVVPTGSAITTIKNKATVQTDILPIKETQTVIHNIVKEEEKGIFDLELDKRISEITLMNSKGVTTYSYDTNLAKIEISAKTIVNSTIVIKYKLTVANIGEEAGYAKTIVDNIPTGLEFNSELNSGWYEKDGKIYTNILENQIIKPGEMKEVYLYLSKTLTTDEGVKIKNTAEITESSNIKDIADINDNETSSAEVIVTVRTGTVTYLVTSLLGISLLAGGVFIIKKFVII